MLIQPETLHEMVFAVDLFIKYTKVTPQSWAKLTTQQKMSRMEDMLDEHYRPGNETGTSVGPQDPGLNGGAKAAPSRSHPVQPRRQVGCGG
jgi:hypothetical protein